MVNYVALGLGVVLVFVALAFFGYGSNNTEYNSDTGEEELTNAGFTAYAVGFGFIIFAVLTFRYGIIDD